MDKHENKACPKCGKLFECKLGNIANCQCSTIHLSPVTLDFLSRTSYDCLCKDCLIGIERQVKLAKKYHFPAQREMLMEGLHYYQEGDHWVFTELYHLLRGHCCKSGCRHCVYGFSKIDKR